MAGRSYLHLNLNLKYQRTVKKKKIHICLFISVTTKTTKIRAVLVSGE